MDWINCHPKQLQQAQPLQSGHRRTHHGEPPHMHRKAKGRKATHRLEGRTQDVMRDIWPSRMISSNLSSSSSPLV